MGSFRLDLSVRRYIEREEQNFFPETQHRMVCLEHESLSLHIRTLEVFALNRGDPLVGKELHVRSDYPGLGGDIQDLHIGWFLPP